MTTILLFSQKFIKYICTIVGLWRFSPTSYFHTFLVIVNTATDTLFQGKSLYSWWNVWELVRLLLKVFTSHVHFHQSILSVFTSFYVFQCKATEWMHCFQNLWSHVSWHWVRITWLALLNVFSVLNIGHPCPQVCYVLYSFPFYQTKHTLLTCLWSHLTRSQENVNTCTQA